MLSSTLVFDFETIDSSISGNWWNYISPSFSFCAKIPFDLLHNYPAESNGICIHKLIQKGDRFPTVRYTLILINEETQKVESFELEKKDISEYLAENFISYLQAQKSLPPNTAFKKIQKNQLILFEYTPTKYDCFQLKIDFTKAEQEIRAILPGEWLAVFDIPEEISERVSISKKEQRELRHPSYLSNSKAKASKPKQCTILNFF